MPKRPNSSRLLPLAILLPLAAFAWWALNAVFGDLITRTVYGFLEDRLSLSEAKLTASLVGLVIPALVGAGAVYGAFRLGRWDREASRPPDMEILFSPTDPNCVMLDQAMGYNYRPRPESGVTSYAIGVRNNMRDKSIHDFRLVFDGDDVIRHFQLATSFQPRQLEPLVTDYFFLVSIVDENFPMDSSGAHYDPSLHTRQEFRVQARAKDTLTHMANFVWEPSLVRRERLQMVKT